MVRCPVSLRIRWVLARSTPSPTTWPSALARSVLVADAIVIEHGVDLCILMAANLRYGDTERSFEPTARHPLSGISIQRSVVLS